MYISYVYNIFQWTAKRYANKRHHQNHPDMSFQYFTFCFSLDIILCIPPRPTRPYPLEVLIDGPRRHRRRPL